MKPYEVENLYERKTGKDEILAAFREIVSAPDFAEQAGTTGKELALLAAAHAHPEALNLLFEAGVDPALTDDYGYTLLHEAAKMEYRFYEPAPDDMANTVNLLLDKKVSVLRRDENKNMACYHYAAEAANYRFVETLAARGCKLNMTDRDGNTGVHIAALWAKEAVHGVKLAEEAVEFQKQRGDNKAVDSKIAVVEEHKQKLENYFKTVNAFASGGVDIDEKNSMDQPALDLAVKSGAKKIAAFLSGKLGGGDDEAAVAAGGMSLHEAAEKNDADAIRAIAKTGADMNALSDREDKPYKGLSALSVACAFLNAGAVLALLECGADPAYRDSSGRAAPAYCFPPGAMASLHSGIFKDKIIPTIFRAMMDRGLSVNGFVTNDSDTILLLACKTDTGRAYNGYTLKGTVIEEALKNRADFNISNRFGETPLMWASGKDFDGMEKFLPLFLEGGADVLAKDGRGNTALHYAAANDSKNGAKTCAETRLEFGADAKAVNNEGKSALDIAVEKNNEPLVKLLLGRM
jgi:ankyrin repeat protein